MSTPPVRRDVIVIGASAGGLPHLSTLLELLPADLPAIVLVVLHRPGDRASQLREVLARRSQMQVVEAVHGEELLVGVCYLGQPAEHLGIDELVQAKLTADPGGARRGRTIDDLFVSVARHAGPRVIGVVLSGMLRDGTEGLAAIKRAGGIALVQSPAEAQFAGMPESAIASGHIDLVAPTAELGAGHRALCPRRDTRSSSARRRTRKSRPLKPRHHRTLVKARRQGQVPRHAAAPP